jgi:exonuclease SbcD
VRVLLGGDFHLGAKMGWLGGQAAARREDLNRAFVRFVDFALRPESRIDLVLLLGDVFDRHAPAPPLVDLVRGEIGRLVEAGLPVAAIPGSHDGYGYPDSIWRSGRLPAEMTLIVSPGVTRTTMSVAGTPVHLYGLAYDPGRTPADPLSGLRRDPAAGDGVHIGMVHGSLPASPEWEFRRRDLPIPTADLAGSGLQLLALGHYHNFMERWFDDTPVVYPGTLEGLKYAESGERAFVVVDFAGGRAAIERTPYPGRRLVDEEFNLDLVGQAAEALERRLEEMAGLDRIVRLTLTGHAPPGFEAAPVRSRMAGRFFHLDIEDRTLSVDPRFADRIAGERTVRGLFVRRLSERIARASETEKPLLSAALRLGLAEFGAEDTSDDD